MKTLGWLKKKGGPSNNLVSQMEKFLAFIRPQKQVKHGSLKA